MASGEGREQAPFTVNRADIVESQLADITSYLVARTGSTRAALDVLGRLEMAFENLARFPYLGVVPRRPSLSRRGYRMLVVGRYLVFYKVREDCREIMVYGIFHGAQDYESWL